MIIFIPAVTPGNLELESGTDRLLLESGDLLLLESSLELTVNVIDEMLILPIPYDWLIPSAFFQPDPGTLFETVWLPGIGQQEPESLMPVYDERPIFGDISNMPYFTLQLFDSVHFGPDGTGAFKGPSTFDILEGDADFEIRTPE